MLYREQMIAVVAASYKRAGSILETLETVVDRSYGELDYVFIDRGSMGSAIKVSESCEFRVSY